MHHGKPSGDRRPRHAPKQGFGLARALSKLGYCSRSQAWDLIQAGRVRLNGTIQRDPERRVNPDRDRIEVDGKLVRAEAKIYLMLNKPRGLVTTAEDEQGRETVFDCFKGRGLPWIPPVGRLDKASEGLLLFSNDTVWAAKIADPETHLDKVYHVQIDCLADQTLADRMQTGIDSEGDFLSAKAVRILRHGTRNSWLEVILDEGKNRHIRRLLGAFDVEVLRLMRVMIGSLELGNLAKGEFRFLTQSEVESLIELTQRRKGSKSQRE